MRNTQTEQSDDKRQTDNKHKQLADNESSLDEGRKSLRNFAVSLREAHDSPLAPAKSASPTFLLGENKGFTGVVEAGKSELVTGQMSKKSYEDFTALLKEAGQTPDAAGRQAAAGKAAKVVATEWTAKHGLDQTKAGIVHEARAQVAFAAQEITGKLGLNKAESYLAGQAIEHALAKEGFRVLVNKALDTVADYKVSSSAVAHVTGARHQMDKIFESSAEALSKTGVTREGLKDLVNKHSGKLTALATAFSSRDELVAVAQTLAKAPNPLAAFKDDAFRKDAGTLLVSGGEAGSAVSKGLGSAAVLAGAALRGDSAEDMGRHALRMGLSMVGGAAGGIAGGAASFGGLAIPGAIAGQALGGYVADKVLDQWDKLHGKDPSNPTASKSTFTAEEVSQSRENMKDRATGAASGAVGRGADAATAKTKPNDNEMSMSRG